MIEILLISLLDLKVKTLVPLFVITFLVMQHGKKPLTMVGLDIVMQELDIVIMKRLMLLFHHNLILHG